jgi:hypothetical protein
MPSPKKNFASPGSEVANILMRRTAMEGSDSDHEEDEDSDWD